jgi:hypothetical protein
MPVSTNGHGPPPCGTKATGIRVAGRARRSPSASQAGPAAAAPTAAVAVATPSDKTSRRVGSVAVGVVMTPIVASLRSRR